MKNNNEQFENFIRDFDTIRMTQTEKNEIGKNLELFTRTYVPTPSPYYSYVSFFKKSLALALIAVLSFSASKPASAKALPGELLYNVKIIHEKIEAASIKTPEKKVTFEIKRTETRIREAVQLAETKKLDTPLQVKLAEDIKEHVQDIAEKIEEIKIENPEQALALNSELKTTLKVNSKALKEVTKKKRKKKSKKKNKVKVVETIKEEISDPIKPEISEAQDEIDTASKKTDDTLINLTSTEETLKDESNILEIDVFSAKTAEEDLDLIQNIEPEIESFADLILDSIEDDIEKTEVVSDNIEEEIIADEIIEPEAAELDIKPMIDIEIFEPENTNTESETIDIASSMEIDPAVEIETPIAEVNEGDIEIIEVSISEETKISVEENIRPDIEISSEVEIEIASLEHILIAEETLQILSDELSYKRDLQKIETIKNLIESKHLGQAFIAVQREITELSELKLQRNLISELGINVKIESVEENISAQTEE